MPTIYSPHADFHRETIDFPWMYSWIQRTKITLSSMVIIVELHLITLNYNLTSQSANLVQSIISCVGFPLILMCFISSDSHVLDFLKFSRVRCPRTFKNALRIIEVDWFRFLNTNSRHVKFSSVGEIYELPDPNVDKMFSNVWIYYCGCAPSIWLCRNWILMSKELAKKATRTCHLPLCI